MTPNLPDEDRLTAEIKDDATKHAKADYDAFFHQTETNTLTMESVALKAAEHGLAFLAQHPEAAPHQQPLLILYVACYAYVYSSQWGT